MDLPVSSLFDSYSKRAGSHLSSFRNVGELMSSCLPKRGWPVLGYFLAEGFLWYFGRGSEREYSERSSGR
jgi:hypothetical protein